MTPAHQLLFLLAASLPVVVAACGGLGAREERREIVLREK
jgi:hypothetical protein